MSYEPTLLCMKKDLDKHKELILNGDWQYSGTKQFKKDQKTGTGEDGMTVMEYIKDVYATSKPLSIGGIQLIAMAPCFSSFNGHVRNKLKELNVEFAEDN